MAFLLQSILYGSIDLSIYPSTYLSVYIDMYIVVIFLNCKLNMASAYTPQYQQNKPSTYWVQKVLSITFQHHFLITPSMYPRFYSCRNTNNVPPSFLLSPSCDFLFILLYDVFYSSLLYSAPLHLDASSSVFLQYFINYCIIILITL